MFAIINALSRDHDANMSAAKNPRTPHLLLTRLLERSSPEVQKVIVRSGRLSQEVLKQIVMSPTHHGVKRDAVVKITDSEFLGMMLFNVSLPEYCRLIIAGSPYLTRKDVTAKVESLIHDFYTESLRSDNSSLRCGRDRSRDTMFVSLLESATLSEEEVAGYLFRYATVRNPDAVSRGDFRLMAGNTRLRSEPLLILASRGKWWDFLTSSREVRKTKPVENENWFFDLCVRFLADESQLDIEKFPENYIFPLARTAIEERVSSTFDTWNIRPPSPSEW